MRQIIQDSNILCTGALSSEQEHDYWDHNKQIEKGKREVKFKIPEKSLDLTSLTLTSRFIQSEPRARTKNKI